MEETNFNLKMETYIHLKENLILANQSEDQIIWKKS